MINFYFKFQFSRTSSSLVLLKCIKFSSAHWMVLILWSDDATTLRMLQLLDTLRVINGLPRITNRAIFVYTSSTASNGKTAEQILGWAIIKHCSYILSGQPRFPPPYARWIIN